MGFEEQKWFNMDADHVLNELHTRSTNGLEADDADKRQLKYGKNKLTKTKQESNFKKIMKQFNDVLIYVLIAAAILTAILAQFIDTTVIMLVIVINAVIGYIQENKAEQALDAIKGMLSLRANVLRNGERKEIDAEELVKGDIVLLNAGDKIPADLRLFKCDNLTIEESALTGESLSVEKKTDVLKDDTVLGDRINMAFSGTSVSSGRGTGVVVEVGNDTELGKINRSITEVEEIKTPLLQQTATFGRQIAATISAIGLLIFVFAFFLRDYDLGELTLSIVALLVAAIPSGLPAVMSIILAISVQNMAKRKAIVRNLPSAETLGSVSVICSDKTGTLTKNEMTVRTVVTPDDTFSVTGTGYAPEGQIKQRGSKVNVNDHYDLQELLLSVKTANDAVLTKDETGHWVINGEPTDGSLITLTEKVHPRLKNLTVETKIPFDSEYKYMASLAEYKGEKYIFVKGAPEKLFDMANFQGADGDIANRVFKRTYWEEKVDQLAVEGERVIGAGYKKIPSHVETINHDDLQGSVVFLGLAGILDPPREEAILAVDACHEAEIKVKMITGDHPKTAYAIGKQMNIGNKHGALEGKIIDQMSGDDLADAVKKYDVFARTSPHDKLRLVEALQKNGETCSMTGDGVNDAPSLKKADIGVAMGIKGTEVAKDASEMILVDDNFKTIVNAIEEGRKVYDNLKKTILFLLPTNGAEAFLVAGSILLGMSMALTPVQILWVNMITAVTIGMALAFEGVEKGTMSRPPRSRESPLLNGYYVFRISYLTLIIGLACLYLFIDLTNNGYEHAVVQTIVLNAIVFAEMFYLFNCRSEKDAAFNKAFFSNKVAFLVSGILVVFELGITYVPFLNTVLGTAPMTLSQWLLPISLGVIVFVVVEIEKFVTRMVIQAR